MNVQPGSISTSSPARERLVRIDDVVTLTTLSKSCINLWVAQGRFPRPTALSSTVKVWRLSDLLDWIDAKFESPDESSGPRHSVEGRAV